MSINLGFDLTGGVTGAGSPTLPGSTAGFHVDTFTATASQTAFTLSRTLTSKHIVFLNGAAIGYEEGYSGTGTGTLTFDSGLNEGDEVVVLFSN